HPYTKALLRSVPVLGYDGTKELEAIDGMTPNPADCVDGCDFANRCKYCKDSCYCGRIDEVNCADGHIVRCRLYQRTGGEEE
ncbi:MAG: peptide ABC transporter ATP-binding protein, partial [Raoultibacter sp.]